LRKDLIRSACSHFLFRAFNLYWRHTTKFPALNSKQCYLLDANTFVIVKNPPSESEESLCVTIQPQRHKDLVRCPPAVLRSGTAGGENENKLNNAVFINFNEPKAH